MKNRFDIKFWLGIGISIFFLVILFKKIDFNQVLAAFRTVSYRYVLLAVVMTFISYFLRSLRWRYLLVTEKHLPITSLYSATIIGYMANNLLPARLGEFVRAYTLAQKEQLETPAVFASLVIDRLCDGFTVMLMLLITVFTMQFPAGMADVGNAVKTGGMLMFTLYGLVILFLLFLKRQTMRTLALVQVLLKPFPAKVSEKLIPLLGSFISGIRMSARGRHMAAVAVLSLLVWSFATWPIDLVLQSFGYDLPLSASMFIMVLLVFAVMVPASPGYIGTYHYACVKGLSVFGLSEAASISIALIIHSTGFFPVILAGFYHLWSNKISLNDVRKAGTA